MAHVNKVTLAARATDIGLRVNEVCQDPAVVKAAKQAGAYTAQATRSIGILTAEITASWRRSGGGQTRTPRWAGPSAPAPGFHG